MKQLNRRKVLLAATSGSVLLAAPSILRAQSQIPITIASSHPLAAIWVGQMKEMFQPRVDELLADSGYQVRWREAYGGTLYNWRETLTALGDGIADIGWMGSVWEQGALPLQQISYYTPFSTDDTRLMVDVFDDLHLTNETLSSAWHAQNTHFLGGTGVDTYNLWTREPIRSVEDLQGLKLLAPGASAAFLAGTGAIPVDAAIQDFYTMIQQGTADGVQTFASVMGATRAYEVTPYFTEVSVGSQWIGGLATNWDSWNDWPEEVRVAFTVAGKEYGQSVADQTLAREAQVLGLLPDAGVQMSVFPAQERQAWIDALPNLSEEWIAQSGSPDAAQSILTQYMTGLRNGGASPGRNWA